MVANCNAPLIVGGDLNTVLDTEDRLHGHPVSQSEVRYMTLTIVYMRMSSLRLELLEVILHGVIIRKVRIEFLLRLIESLLTQPGSNCFLMLLWKCKRKVYLIIVLSCWTLEVIMLKERLLSGFSMFWLTMISFWDW